MDADVSNYFVFAEQGVVVALRPGDMLIFNPKYHHCLSSRTSAYENKDIFSLLLYLKSAAVGQNNNTIPLKKVEIVLLEGIFNP
jgi:ectoine hydroxylase-related dioxygenase (phytanoyl-CoA dioxygenase family)